MKSFGYLNNAKGAVAPLVAIMLVVIILCVAVVVDLGHIHNVKIQLQRAVDAAALAGANALPDEDAAVAAATAVTAANRVDANLINTETDIDLTIALGTWNKEIVPGQTAADRFDETGTPPNAVQVTATRVVDHVFFFFLPSTTVTTNAIAVDLVDIPTIPLALISCIPSTGPQAGELTACGIKTYTFSSNENTAGWTGLTAGGTGGSSKQEIEQFFDENRDFFNEVVGLLETRPISSPPPPFDDGYQGCEGNIDTSIDCGLGGEFDSYISPGSVPDPLTRYSAARLPRYITTNSDELQAFEDIITQDGYLKQDSPDYAVYQTKLGNLYNGTLNPYGDNRFQYDTVNNKPRLIKEVTDKNDLDGDGSTTDKIFVPDFDKVVDYAGYPPVSATTGSMASVMQTLLDQVTDHETGSAQDVSFKSFLSHEVFPFNEDGESTSGARGETLLFYVPVIFAGSCDSFDPNSHENNNKAEIQEENELHYVGIANFLVTRLWQGGGCYRNGTPVTIGSLPSGCNQSEIDSHQPSLLNDSYTCPMGVNPLGSIAFEALIRPPLNDEEVKGVQRVVLVE